MVRKILVVALVAMVFAGYAQKKPKLGKALRYFNDKELALAKDEIDRAAEYEKTKDDPKTWYYRGLIYAALDTTSNPDYQNIADQPLKTAVESFTKSDELNDKDKEMSIPNPDMNGLPIFKYQQIDMLWGEYLNRGAEAYNAQDMDLALVDFEKALMLKPNDTTTNLYAGTVAAMSDQNDKALKYFYAVKDNGMHDRDVYGSIINLERSHNKDTAQALAVVREAIDQFEDNDSFKKEEINILIMSNQVEAATDKIEENIADDPQNETLYYSLGYLNDQIGSNAQNRVEQLKEERIAANNAGEDDKVAELDAQIEEQQAKADEYKKEAVEAYKKAIELKPDYFEANFNAGVFYFNEAIAKNNEINNLGVSKADVARAKELRPMVSEYFKLAMPFFERAYEVRPDDASVVETLAMIYAQVGEDEKAAEMQEKADALEGN